MTCLCEQVTGTDIELSPTCIGHLWIFQNHEAEEIEALSREAFFMVAAQVLFAPATFLIISD